MGLREHLEETEEKTMGLKLGLKTQGLLIDGCRI